MKYPELTKILADYGLKERHAKVYLALLTLGSASIQKISEKSKCPRSTCEFVLSSLKEKGFVSSFKKKNIRHYSAEDPNKVIRMADYKAEVLRGALPKFLNLYHQRDNIPSVRMYEGNPGMQTVFQEILDEADQIYYFGSAQDFFEVLPKDKVEAFVSERVRRKIPVKIILRDTPIGRERADIAQSILAQAKMFSKAYDCNGIIFIWNNKIVLFSLRNDFSAYILENKELAGLLKTALNIIWDLLPEYSKSKLLG